MRPKGRWGGLVPIISPEQKRRGNEKYQKTIRGALVTRLAKARIKAKKYNFPCTITPDQLVNQWNSQNGCCYYTGIPMSTEYNLRETVSIDKIDPMLGYVDGNVVLCCLIVNIMKLDMLYGELLEWCNKIADYAMTNL